MLLKVVENFQYVEGDGVFSVFAHGTGFGIVYTDEKGNLVWATMPEEINTLLSNSSSEWKQAMEEGKQITLCFYSCNPASEEYINSSGNKITMQTTIAQEMSVEYPNVTVIGANGQVVYGENFQGFPTILGVKNHRDDGGDSLHLKKGQELESDLLYSKVGNLLKKDLKKR